LRPHSLTRRSKLIVSIKFKKYYSKIPPITQFELEGGAAGKTKMEITLKAATEKMYEKTVLKQKAMKLAKKSELEEAEKKAKRAEAKKVWTEIHGIRHKYNLGV
jgi:hypothetical protein